MHGSNCSLRIGFMPALLVFLATVAAVSGQNEMLDGSSFVPPEGWERTASDSAIAFSKQDRQSGRFCQMTLYRSTASSGTAKADFESEWAAKVKPRFPTIPVPESRSSQLPDNTDARIGSTRATSQRIEAAAILVTYRRGGRVQSLLTLMNDAGCQSDFESFAASIRLSGGPGEPLVRGGEVQDSRPVQNNIVGTWIDIGSGDFAVRTPSGGVSTGRGGSGRAFAFRSNGTYEYSYSADGVMAGLQILIHETGSYRVSGTTLTLLAKTKLYRRNGVDDRSNPNETRTYAWTLERDGPITVLVLKQGNFVDRLRLDTR